MHTIFSETVEDLQTFENARSQNIERVEKNITRKEKEVSNLKSAIDDEVSSNAALLNHIKT